jgi:hypothetical protein
VGTLVPSGNRDFNWGILSNLETHGISGNQDVGIASEVVKYGTAGTWQYFGNTKDVSGLPQTGRGANVACEFNLLVNGPENATAAFNPITGGRTYFELMSRTYKPANWTPLTAYALNASTQPVSGASWAAVTTHLVGDIVRATGGAIPQSAFQCTVAGTTGSTEPVWNIVLGSTIVDGSVTWLNINNSGNGYTYVCTAPGTSGATEPVWPTAPGGSVTDGSVIWQYGTTLTAQISRVIHIGDSDHGAVSYGAAIVVTSPCYDAIIELSGASLDTVFNPNAAAIRLASEMPIDFSGNFTSFGQNLHTLRYTTAGMGAQRLSYQNSSGEILALRDDGAMVWGSDTIANSIIELNSANGTPREFRFMTAGVERWAIRSGSIAETGGNSGSDFRITRYNDAGGGLGDALTITRATGAISSPLFINAVNDAAAATAGVQIGQWYRNGSVMMQRVA